MRVANIGLVRWNRTRLIAEILVSTLSSCPLYLLCSSYPSVANQVSDDSLDDVFTWWRHFRQRLQHYTGWRSILTVENPVVSILAGVPGAAVHVAGAVRDPD